LAEERGLEGEKRGRGCDEKEGAGKGLGE